MSIDKYLKNAWYVAAWSNEVGRSLFTRTILEQPILFYRKANGEAVAIGNACPHRFAPLNLGKLVVGDVAQADPSTIPDFSCHTDPELAFVGGVIEMKANYELITDNLLDLAHGESAGDLWRQVIKGAFEGQDQVVIEAQQRMLGNRTFDEAGPVLFASDAAAQRGRKKLAKLIREQLAPKPQNVSLQDLRRRVGVTCSPILPVV